MELVYYYCGAKAFENIINNKQLWLSDVVHSNDSDELIWYTNIIKTHFEELFKKASSTIENFDFEKNKLTFEYIFDSKLSRKICFAMCFSELGDDLSQWRGYGEDGKGYAIGFNKNLIMQLAYAESLQFDRVKYQEGWDTKKTAKDKDEQRLNKIQSKLNMASGSWQSLKNYYAGEIRELIKTIPFYKNPAFQAEKEWRLCFFDNRETASNNKCLALHFNENGFIPHLEINFKKYPDLIQEIIIGPTNMGDIKMLKPYCQKNLGVNVDIKESILHYKKRG